MNVPHPSEPNAPAPGEPGPADVAQALRDGIPPSSLLETEDTASDEEQTDGEGA